MRRSLLSLIPILLLGCVDDDSGFDDVETATVQVNPSAIDFPKVGEGLTEERSVEVRNIGTGPLLIARIERALSADADYAIYFRADPAAPWRVAIDPAGVDHATYPIRVPAAASLFLAIEFTPRAETIADGELRLDTSVGPVVIPVRHTDSGPELVVTPASLDFGRVAADETRTLSIEATNIGQAPLRFDQVILNGSQDFTPRIEGRDPRRQPEILEDPDHDGVPGLAPGATLVIDIEYAPATEGPDRGEVAIFSSDPRRPEVVVTVTGNGASPCLDVDPGAVEFRSSLVNRSDSRPVALRSCGGGALVVDEVYLGPDTDPAFSLVDVPDGAFELPAVGADGVLPSVSLRVEFTPREERVHDGSLVVVSNDPAAPSRTISLLGRGVQNACPIAVPAQETFEVVPLDVVLLDGSPSIDRDGPDGRPVQYEWVIIGSPEGSHARPVEAFYDANQPGTGGWDDDLTTPNALLFADIAGTYVLELRVRDNLGLSSDDCETTSQVVIQAIPDQAIHVQLTWETAGDPDETDNDGTDLDLHLLHPNADDWFSAPYDCYFSNPTPDWGQLENPADDPSLDIDDVNGAGPENITLDQPEDTSVLGAPYLVGVHAYSLQSRTTGHDFGPAKATVRIYIRGELAWDFTGEDEPGLRTMEETGGFWDVAAIEWPSGTITTRDRYRR